MIAPARKVAHGILRLIELRGAHSDEALHSESVSCLENRDRNLVMELTYGVLRWQGWLDYVLGKAISRSWDTVDPEVRTLLRLGLYQMSCMDRIPDHALINDTVELAKHSCRPGAGRFVNGVLRKLSRQRPWVAPEFHRDCPIWARISMPRWLWERWEARFGTDRACEYALSLNQAPRAAFRLREKVEGPGNQPAEARTVSDEGREYRSHPPMPGVIRSELVPEAYLVEEGRLRYVSNGQWVQDEASQLIPHLFGPVEGACVWDACAAPGGKSAILLERCGPSGWVISSDLDPHRARRMRAKLTGCGGARSDVLIADAESPFPFRIFFDAVLADVPCSGLGTLRRNPEIKWRLQEEQLFEFGLRARRLLGAVAGAVRIGGRVLYSTCSTEPEENELVVGEFLRSHPEFSLQKPLAPSGIDEWLDQKGMFRSFPSTRPWDGFFAALMVRTA
jgi:16S rRNA (cytosine967-C5)-methyltransferase